MALKRDMSDRANWRPIGVGSRGEHPGRRKCERRASLPDRRAGRGSVRESEMLERYVPLVRQVVGQVARSLPAHVDGEDLYSAGLMGLLQALRHFNPQAGSALESYARVRIRGAIFDELRRMDWVPRSIHAKARRLREVRQQLEQSQARAATETEMARALEVSVGEYRQWQEEVRPATFVCLDAAVQNDHDDNLSQYESLPDLRQEDPHEGTARRELAEMIAAQLQQLPDMQRKVLALYYYEDMRLREIAEIFGLTESRICQIHAQALLNIKARLVRFEPTLAWVAVN